MTTPKNASMTASTTFYGPSALDDSVIAALAKSLGQVSHGRETNRQALEAIATPRETPEELLQHSLLNIQKIVAPHYAVLNTPYSVYPNDNSVDAALALSLMTTLSNETKKHWPLNTAVKTLDSFVTNVTVISKFHHGTRPTRDVGLYALDYYLGMEQGLVKSRHNPEALFQQTKSGILEKSQNNVVVRDLLPLIEQSYKTAKLTEMREDAIGMSSSLVLPRKPAWSHQSITL